MSVDPTTFKVRFPEFDSISDTRIQLFLDDAEIILNPTYWDTKLDLGQSYLTAHYLSLAIQSGASGGSTGASGPITARAVDGVSISYASAAPNDQSEAYYAQTIYGQRYIALRKTLGVLAFVA